MPAKRIVAASIGECIHIAGVLAFLELARQHGYETIFLGAAVPFEAIVDAIRTHDPEIVAVSYRLSPETAEPLLRQFAEAVRTAGLTNRRFAFGGTPPVADIARKVGIFDAVFSGGESVEELIAFLRGATFEAEVANAYPQTLLERIEWRKPFPVIRHHFGLPSVEATVEGVRQIAEAQVLDIISLGIDQDAQENFFHPELQDPRRKGAGGVPIRSANDLRAIYEASRCGNYPLLRAYAGTRDLIRMAELYLETINLCFAAIPLFWFCQLDRRGPMSVEEAIRVHQETMRWLAQRNVPVEVNEPHHWSLRGAPDHFFVATAFLSAYNAKACGVKHYIAQFMFDTPAGVSFTMDLAKMLAALEMIQPLADNNFHIHVETRGGLPSYPTDLNAAKGQLASSLLVQMTLKPEIVHVVGFCEADHAATPEEIIESCKIAQQVIRNALRGLPDMTLDPRVQQRKHELKRDAQLLLDAIAQLGGGCERAWADPAVLAEALRIGLLDAPEIPPSEYAKARIHTRIINGACITIDPHTNAPISEKERIQHVMQA